MTDWSIQNTKTGCFLRCVSWTAERWRRTSWTKDVRMAWHGTQEEATCVRAFCEGECHATLALHANPEDTAIGRIALHRAFRILANHRLEELGDRTFGDSEVYWMGTSGNHVATGYFGGSSHASHISVDNVIVNGATICISLDGDAADHGRRLYSDYNYTSNNG